MKVLFWNTHKNKNINTILSEIIMENNINIVALAEYADNLDNLKNELLLNGLEMRIYYTNCERIKLIGNLSCVEPRHDTYNATIQLINGKYILCCVHLNSKLYAEHEEIREIHIEEIIYDIKNVEKEENSENTIIVGDFNINPYDSSCVDARFFHGIPICNEAKRRVRKIAGREYSMFYNPMWNFLGDFNKPYGTYYYNGGRVKNTYWNIFDQVIIRPSLRNRFIDSSLKILTETKTRYLLDEKGHPDKKISDHLPIVFEIKED